MVQDEAVIKTPETDTDASTSSLPPPAPAWKTFPESKIPKISHEADRI